MSKVVYENEYIVVRELSESEVWLEVIATIENKTLNKLRIEFINDYMDLETIILEPKSTRGLLDYQYYDNIEELDAKLLDALESGECEFTQIYSDNIYSCASDNEDTEKSQEEMREELEGLKSDIYYSLSDFERVCGGVAPELDDNLAMWDFINTMERVSEELRESYTQYEDLEIRLRG